MNSPSFRNWQSVQDEVLRRIHAREWKPGDQIPNESDLALEFGCARTTVNRALRALAENGLLDRRRKAGTRVAAHPVAKATLDIAVIRQEVEARGQRYTYQRMARAEKVPPTTISTALQVAQASPLLHVRALHLANDTPYALEDRWINLDVVPRAQNEAFLYVSANEWLLQNAPYTHGQIAFSAVNATSEDADTLDCAPKEALVAVDRITWDRAQSVTKVRILYGAGHQLTTQL